MSGANGLINDCFLHDKERLRHQDALDLLRNNISSIVPTESCSLNDSLNRIVSTDVQAPQPVPGHTNSAVDGYAFSHADFSDARVDVSQQIAAGDLNPPPLTPGTAARIFTGAPMPPGADTVAMQEDCIEDDQHVELPPSLKIGTNCRLAGEDVKRDETIVRSGRRLRAADLAALASIGCEDVPVYCRLRIKLFSSGNELVPVADSRRALRAGEMFDANMPLITSLSSALPVDIDPGSVLKDTFQSSLDAIEEAAQSNDVIITTGGASRGAEDHMLSVLDRLGKRHVWQLAVKPGRPMMFGQIPRSKHSSDCFFFGLPGNPVAAMVCFLMYVRPTLLALSGATWSEPIRYSIPADFEISNKKPDRREFLRGILVPNDEGTTRVQKFGRDGSGLISSLRQSDGLIEIAEDTTQISRGDLVDFIPYSALV